MPDKISDNDIKKALEDLKKCNNNEIDCGNCTLSEFYPRCPEEIGELALDYINRLEAENLNLQEKNLNLISDLTSLQKENKRLENTLDDVLDRQPILVERSEKYSKAEAIKECFEKVKAKVESWTYNFECYSDKRKALERLEKYFEDLVGE